MLPADRQMEILSEMVTPADQATRHRRRDAAIREIAATYSDLSRLKKSKKVAMDLARYRATSWRMDQYFLVLPPHLSFLRRAMFAALKNNAGDGLAYRQIYEVIS